jgi:hypothetical protein
MTNSSPLRVRSSSSHPTKAQLFFAAMVPPALNVEDLLSIPADDLSVEQQLEGIAVGMMRYSREVMPILMRLVTHPEFDVGQFAQRHPRLRFGRMHLGLIQYLESQRERARIVAENVGARCLEFIRGPAQPRLPRAAGRARWQVR